MSEPETAPKSEKRRAGLAKRNPPPEPKPSAPPDEIAARVGVTRTSLLNAQHWLDTGIALMRKDARADVTAPAQMAGRFLKEAAAAIEETAASLHSPELLRQVDETSRAMADFQELVWAAPTFNERADDIAAADIRIRVLLDLPEVKRGPHMRASKQNDVYEAQALGPVLDLIRIEANQAFLRLRDLEKDGQEPNREQVIGASSEVLRGHLGHALHLLRAHNGEESAKFGSKIDAATIATLKIDRWIRGRTGNKRLMTRFSPVLDYARLIRAEVKLPALDHVDTPRMPRSVEVEEDRDRAAFARASSDLDAARTNFFEEFMQGVRRFKQFEQLKRPEPDTSVLEELGKGILVAAIGNLAGAALGKIFLNAIEGTATDSVEAIVGKAADGAFAKVKSENASRRHLQFFIEGFEDTQLALEQATSFTLHKRYEAHDITQAEIEEKSAAILGLSNVADKTYQAAAHAYASLVSREGLGYERQGSAAGSAKIGSTKEYFGAVPDTLEGRLTDALPGPPRSRRGGKAGASGVGKLTVSYHGELGISGFEIHGMNGDMAEAVLERAEYDLKKLDLVCEVHFVQPVRTIAGPAGPLAVAQRIPKMVIDEHGALRGHVDWDAFDPIMKTEKIVASPETAWRWLAQQRLSKRVIDK